MCGLRGSALSSSKLLANAMMNEGKGTQIAATPALATIQLDGDATETSGRLELSRRVYVVFERFVRGYYSLDVF